VPAYGLYRRGKAYTDPQTGEFLGLHAQEIGNVQVLATERDITTLMVNRSRQEVRIGDRLLETEERAVSSTFFPSDPEGEVEGLILDVPNGVTQIGQYDVLILNKGALDNLKEGNVLAIYKTGELVRDRIHNERVRLPDERAGLLMVFRVYDRMSYGIVLNAQRQLAIMDKVRNPCAPPGSRPPGRHLSPPHLPHQISPSPAMLCDSTDRRLAWLALSLLPGVGPAARRLLLDQVDDPLALLHDLDCPVAGRLPPRVQQGLSLYRQGDPRIDRHIEQSRAWLQQADCHLLTIDDPHYPPLLREISDPPLVLFVQGSAQLLSDPQIAMVGTRHPGPHGA